MICPECYSNHSRMTPLLNPEECLRLHLQYVCGTCGRCICIQEDHKRKLQRWMFPFSTFEKAKLYLRTADFTNQKSCGIYELANNQGRKSYKIFPDAVSLTQYLRKNPNKRALQENVLFKQEPFFPYANTVIERLSVKEISVYLQEQEFEKKRR